MGGFHRVFREIQYKQFFFSQLATCGEKNKNRTEGWETIRQHLLLRKIPIFSLFFKTETSLLLFWNQISGETPCLIAYPPTHCGSTDPFCCESFHVCRWNPSTRSRFCCANRCNLSNFFQHCNLSMEPVQKLKGLPGDTDQKKNPSTSYFLCCRSQTVGLFFAKPSPNPAS